MSTDEKLRIARDAFTDQLRTLKKEPWHREYYANAINCRRIGAALCNYSLNIFITQAWFDQTYVDATEALINAMSQGNYGQEYDELHTQILDGIYRQEYDYLSYQCYSDILDYFKHSRRDLMNEVYEGYLMGCVSVLCGIDPDEVFSIFVNIIKAGVEE